MLRRLIKKPYVPAALVTAAVVSVFVLLAYSLDLFPPRTLSMAAGRPGSGYYAVAEKYRSLLAEDGIALQIAETAGSVENVELIVRGLADVALVQGGIDVPPEANVEAIAAVFLEPLLVFHRGTVTNAGDPAAWSNLRVAAGENGSGTRAAMLKVVQALSLDSASLLPLGGADAVAALRDGRVDAAVFVAPIDAPYLVPILGDGTFTIAPFRDAEALARRLPFIRMADIPASAIDYVQRIPSERIPLAAAIAALVAREDLHPALVDRLVRAAERIHSGPSLINNTISFPSTDGLELPINVQAAAALRSGPTALDRLLPYWISAQISSIALLLVPLFVLLLPMMRVVPTLYDWRMRSRIYRRYDELIAIERELERGVTSDRKRALLERLDLIEAEARTVRVPTRFRENAYTLRMHMDLVRRKLRR